MKIPSALSGRGRRKFLLAAAALCVVSATPKAAWTQTRQVSNPPKSNQPVAGQDYRMGVGDVIRIQVHGEPDLTLEVRLPESGSITYPLLGEIRAVGNTLDQLQTTIENGLRGDYLINPDAQITVVEYRPFFVIGEVTRPGGYPYIPGLTVRKAATLAGGFTERANTKRIFVQRETDTQQKRVSVDLDGQVYPGDTLIVEEGLF